ncbi:nitroreductase [Rhodococcus sp. 15-725-2-2b]|uniref:nitroreductase n=1 Tax=unclassified Rhodococcus (in: high G+C Gram-positive bacteria) TaxID=192944 RepID=UPI000B9A782B|nr:MULTISPECIES: nitroreductase [unclassified Rhodococcus (in: high G+C Gram-positive bacteria)]OZC63596.1 nitroreductase [Rhodococcus sp. 06-469-3-2]OZD40761.1 nitroreductase [Rhodococcus sp. 06-1477-1A]OZE67131.1 nitroreductase [Rhodococcus sp. 15-725-2-2b]
MSKSMVNASEIDADLVVERLLNDRYSCRSFRPDSVDRTVLERLARLAQRSPSWCNMQPWDLRITEGVATEKLREQLTSFAVTNSESPELPFAERIEGKFRERRREVGWQLYEAVGVAKGDREASSRQAMENYRFFGAPHVAIVTTAADLGAYGAIDCGLYLGNFLLAAQSLGLATIPQAAFAAVAPAVRSFFNIPENRQVLFGVSLGYPDTEHPANSFRTGRARIDDVVTFVEN